MLIGAREGTRTPMDEPPDPKSGASTNFATRAYPDIIPRLLIFDKNLDSSNRIEKMRKAAKDRPG